MTRLPTRTRQPDQSLSRPSRAPWRTLGAGAGLAGTEGITAYMHPAFGEALAVADVITLVAIALILLAAILFGGKETVERVFRLLRWAANRPEPPAPPGTSRRRDPASA